MGANACYSDGKSDHECCIHDNKVRLKCGHELPVVNGKSQKQEKRRLEKIWYMYRGFVL